MQLGLDAEQTETLARTFDGAGAQLLGLHASLSVNAQEAWWIGQDANQFRSEWTRTGAVLTQVAQQLQTTSLLLRAQADAQRQCSSAVTLFGGSPLTASPQVRAVDLVSIGAVGGVSVVGAAELRYRVETLSNGELRIGRIASLGGGVGAVLGPASASALLMAKVTETWRIPSEDLDNFLLSQVRGQIDETNVGSLVAASLLSLSGTGNGVVEALRYEAPDPEEIGVGLGVNENARIKAGAIGLGGAVNGFAELSYRPDSDETVLSVTDRVALAAAVPLLGLAGAAEVGCAVVLNTRGDAIRLELSGSQNLDGSLAVVNAAVDLAAPEVQAAGSRFLTEVRNGVEPEAALNRLLVAAMPYSILQRSLFESAGSFERSLGVGPVGVGVDWERYEVVDG